MKTFSGYCARKMHAFINFRSYLANQCLFYPMTFWEKSHYHCSNAHHFMYFI